MLTRTTTRLIEDLKDPANAAAWSAFDDRYRPVLVGFARHLGFCPDDAGELAQRALAEFSAALREGQYQRERGRLSSWLIGIARTLAREMRRREAQRPAGGISVVGDAAAVAPDEANLTGVWRREREQIILARAMEMLAESTRIDARTLRAFELFALRSVPATEVARECGLEVDTVYVIKNRLTKRLREIVLDLQAAYDEDE